MADILFDRSVIEDRNYGMVGTTYDFAYGEFVATNDFLSSLSEIQTQMIEGNMISIDETEVDINTVGGNLALTIHMQNLDAKKETMRGLASLGLKTQNKLWTLLG